MARYAYDAYGVCKVMSSGGAVNTDKNFVGNINPFRYRGYYYDVETKLYYLQSRYYDPAVGRFINADSLEYLDPETVGGLNLYAYCNCNPVMYVDPEGTAWWHWVLAAITVVAITAAVVATAGVAAAAIGSALGVGSSLVSATVTGAAIGGIVSGGTELISQGIASNWKDVDFGSIAIESFTGSLYGAASGMMGKTTSVGLRLAMRGAIVATSAINTALHCANSGEYSFGETMAEVGKTIGIGIAIQVGMIGYDAMIGKLSQSVLENYAIDGALFRLKDKLMIGFMSLYKTIKRNFSK